MSGRADLRDWLLRLAHPAVPEFEPSRDPVLAAFAQLFSTSELLASDADKRLRTDALTPIYDCETESQQGPDGPADRFVAVWSPVWGATDPLTGFRTGRDSAWLGSTPTVAMPQDERTAALLLLVTSEFTHLSAQRGGSSPVIRGAINADGLGYRFVTLVSDTARAQPSSRRMLHEMGDV